MALPRKLASKICKLSECRAQNVLNAIKKIPNTKIGSQTYIFYCIHKVVSDVFFFFSSCVWLRSELCSNQIIRFDVQ